MAIPPKKMRAATQGRPYNESVNKVQIRLYTRCRQRVLRLDLDATFAGFRRDNRPPPSHSIFTRADKRRF